MRVLPPHHLGLSCLIVVSLGAGCGFGDQPRTLPSDANVRTDRAESPLPAVNGNETVPVNPVAENTNDAPSPVPQPVAVQPAKVVCPVEITVDNRTTGQRRSDLEAAYPDLKGTLEKAIQTNCAKLFARQQDVPAGKKPVDLIMVNHSDIIAFASTSENSGSITLSASFFLERAAQKDTFDAVGALHHEAVHLYQQNRSRFPSWAIEGMADFVRYRSGYVKESQRRRGGNYDDAYNTTAFFFDYLDKKKPGFVQRMLQAMGDRNTPYSPSWFTREAGSPLAELWSAYQASL